MKVWCENQMEIFYSRGTEMPDAMTSVFRQLAVSNPLRKVSPMYICRKKMR
jgi:hypothetical protein